MPKFGQMVEESSIVKWHKKEGDSVRKGEILFEIETDKAVMEVESFFEGTLLKILVKENVSVPVSSVVGYIGTPGEAIPATPPPTAAAAPVPPQTPAPAQPAKPQPAPVQQASAALPAVAPRAPASVRPDGLVPSDAKVTPGARAPAPALPAAPARQIISPRAKALVKRSCIDPSPIAGSGPGGRVQERDVRAYMESRNYSAIRISPAAKKLAAAREVDILRVRGTGAGGRIMIHDVERAVAERPRALTKMRQVIARRLTESFTTTPHFYVTVAADITDLLVFRKDLKNRGEVYTVTDFVLEAVIMSLQEFPILNSVCDGRTVRWHGSVDLGMAVSLEDGLVVPAIRNAQDLGMRELHDTAASLAARAREGKLTPDEMTGSTFTVSNMGMLDVDTFHAIINPGEAGILAVATARDRVVARNGKMEIRSMMNMTLSVDHRIVDGSLAADFVNAIRKKLEDVALWTSLT